MYYLECSFLIIIYSDLFVDVACIVNFVNGLGNGVKVGG